MNNTAGVKCAEGWFTTEAWHGERRFGILAFPPDTQLLDFNIIEGRKLTPQDTDAIVRLHPAYRNGKQSAARAR